MKIIYLCSWADEVNDAYSYRQNRVSYLSSWQDLPGKAEVDEFDYPTLAVVKHHVLRLEQDI